jgi:WXG100 family type VII secretion target
MGQIRITPQELRDAAKYLLGCLDIINGEIKEVKNQVDDVVLNWEGSAQKTFIKTFENDLYPILSTTVPQVVEALAEELNGAADALETVDTEVSNAFKN